MRTFVYHEGALGDVLLSVPCFHALRAGSHALHFAGRPEVARFLASAGLVRGAISTDQAAFASLYSGPDRDTCRFLRGFDRAYVFTNNGDSDAAAAIRTVIPSTRTISTNPPVPGIHAARYRLSQVDSRAARFRNEIRPVLPQQQVRRALPVLYRSGFTDGKALIAVHPGSGGRAKCWPLARYFELIERLQRQHDLFPVIFSGPAEEEDLKKEIDAFTRERSALHASDPELIIAASLLSRCRLYIGNDSGFSHLAALFSSAIVLFGPTDPRCWKPSGRRVEVLRPGGNFGSMNDLPVDAVIEKANMLITGPHVRSRVQFRRGAGRTRSFIGTFRNLCERSIRNGKPATRGR